MKKGRGTTDIIIVESDNSASPTHRPAVIREHQQDIQESISTVTTITTTDVTGLVFNENEFESYSNPLITIETEAVALGMIPTHGPVYYLDTGASAHSVNSMDLFLSNAPLVRNVAVKGMGPNEMICTLGGKLHCLRIPGKHLGDALYIEGSSFNLISIGLLMKNGVQVVGSNKTLTLTVVAGERTYESVAHMDATLNVFKAVLTNGTIFYEVPSDVNNNKNLSFYHGMMGVTKKKELTVKGANKDTPVRQRSNFTQGEMLRAKIALDYHLNTLHPSEHDMSQVSSLRLAGELRDTDIALMIEVYGKCPYCALARLQRDTNVPVHSAAPTHVGQIFYSDIRSIDLLKSKEVEIILVCGYSGNLSVIRAENKQPQTLFDAIMLHLQTHFIAFGHTTERIHVDAEETLAATRPLFGKAKIVVTDSYPTGHCAMAERFIRHLDLRTLATLISLPLRWKRNLIIDAHQTVAHYINLTPNSHTYTMLKPTTPFNLRTNNTYAHLNIPRAKFGHTYLVMKDKGYRPTMAKKLDLMKQQIPRGVAAICVGLDESFNTKTSKFLLANGRFVSRCEYHDCPGLILEGWELNDHKLNTSFGRVPIQDLASEENQTDN